MNEFATMNQEQKARVERNLDIVGLVIRTRFNATIKYNGFEYDELYQEGCVKLCEVAIHYPDLSEDDFQKIAYTSIKNRLIRFVTTSLRKRSNCLSLDASNDEDSENGVSFADSVTDEDSSVFDDKVIDSIVTDTMLVDFQRIKEAVESLRGSKHSLGFDIILDMFNGYTTDQIASMRNISVRKVRDYTEHARDYYRRYKHIEDRKAALMMV